jgi:hypothetical protein
MSKEMREQIDRVKNWKQFLKEQNEYKIFRDEPLERIETIPENVNIVEYIKSQLIQKNGEYYYEDDYSKLRKINFGFEGNDILIYPDGKYKLLINDVVEPNGYYFDIRYPNEINQLSQHSPDKHPPFGYRQWVSNTDGKRWVDGNDAFIPVKRVGVNF